MYISSTLAKIYFDHDIFWTKTRNRSIRSAAPKKPIGTHTYVKRLTPLLFSSGVKKQIFNETLRTPVSFMNDVWKYAEPLVQNARVCLGRLLFLFEQLILRLPAEAGQY